MRLLRPSPRPSRVAAAWIGFVCLARIGAAQPADAPSRGDAHRLVWHGHIEDSDFYVTRAKSAGDVNRLPQPFSHEHSIKVDFEYVQETAPDGSVSWPRRRISWSIEGTQGDDTFTESCHGGGSLDLGSSRKDQDLTAEQRQAMQASCEFKKLATAFRPYGHLPSRPPLPRLPGLSEFDESCAYREEHGTERTSIWLTPDVEAVVEMDTKPGTAYARFVPEPGKFVELTVKTVPPFPARFRFVIDRDHTSAFPGYAGNAWIDKWFFKRYHLEHLADEYKDSSPDLIFDKLNFQGRGWSTVTQEVVETSEPLSSATARVSAMDYGAIGKVRVYFQCQCGARSSSGGQTAWTPARIVVGGNAREAVSIPLDEDNNLMADALEDYKGDPGRDDDDTPAGDGTRGDGLTAFEEYRGFLVEGFACQDPMSDEHIRTTPRHKHLFVYASAGPMEPNDHSDPDWTEAWDLWNERTDTDLEQYVEDFFAWGADLSVIPVCKRHLQDVDTVIAKVQHWTASDEYLPVPPESRVVNFTIGGRELWAGPIQFEGQTVHRGPQHGVVIGYDNLKPRIAHGLAIPTEPGTSMGSPKRTAIVLIARDFSRSVELLATIHEMGHAVGIPHHSDSRKDWKAVAGALDVTPGLSPLQAAGLPLSSQENAPGPSEKLDALVIEPCGICREGDPGTVYRKGRFAGCRVGWIVRRGQQESGDTGCPMAYFFADVYEPPGVRATWRWRDVVTDAPNLRPDPSSQREHWWNVDAWGGELLRWESEFTDVMNYQARFCSSTAGTHENAGTGERNLAGDAGRSEPCRNFIVVNDNAETDPK